MKHKLYREFSESLSDAICPEGKLSDYLLKNNFVKIERVLYKKAKKPGECRIVNKLTKTEIPIKKFGRYPHRNKILKRTSTPEEEAFLNQPNSSC